MRLSNFLVGMLACAAITACSNDDNGNPTNNGENSDGHTYLAISLVANNDAMTKTFTNGTEAESAVTSARFYFFNNTGAAYPVSGELNYVTINGLTWNPSNPNTSSTNEGNNVTTTSNAVLVLDGVDAAPTSVVAILNPPTTLGSNSMTLSDLRTVTADYASSDYTKSGAFVMSNSVYADGGKIIDAVNIQGYLANSKEAAIPVDIYVERTVAKVSVSYQNSGNQNTGEEFDSETVYAKINGWALANVRPSTRLIKQLNKSWLSSEPFTGWNSATNYRSYWAESITDDVTNTNSWNDITTTAEKYCNENAGVSSDYTQLLVAAQLVDSKGEAVEIAEILGETMTVDELKKWILSALGEKHVIAFKTQEDPETYTQINAEDIDFRAKNASDPETVKSYEAIAKLADNVSEQLYEKQSDGNYSPVTNETVNGYLEDYVARIWKDGMTYYFTDIKHLNNMTGVVRNHYYQITVTGVSGLGTPVYDPNIDIIPEEVINQSSYLAAKINILAWNIVTNEVTLGE